MPSHFAFANVYAIEYIVSKVHSHKHIGFVFPVLVEIQVYDVRINLGLNQPLANR